MSNIRDLFSDRSRRDHNDSDEDDDNDENNRFVGGIGDRGGGSGLAVRPNPMHNHSNPDAIFNLAQHATSDDQSRVRRTITMYRNGFVVDDGPYRRLDDPANFEFLTSLAKGQTPRELYNTTHKDKDKDYSSSDITVGLIDKRSEEYVEMFQNFSGTGHALGSGNSGTGSSSNNHAVSATSNNDDDDDTVFDPRSFGSIEEEEEVSMTSGGEAGTPAPVFTSIQVRLANGQRRVVRMNVQATVRQLSAQILLNDHNNSDQPQQQRFRLVSGFPPHPLSARATIQEAGLQGAQVSMQNV